MKQVGGNCLATCVGGKGGKRAPKETSWEVTLALEPGGKGSLLGSRWMVPTTGWRSRG